MLAGGHIMIDQHSFPQSVEHPSHIAAPEPRSYDVVVIGASAGGVGALTKLLSALPADFSLPILVVQHISATQPSKLPEVLSYRTPLKVKWAEGGELIKPGCVYVAPPDRHLVVRPNRRIALTSAERVGWWRPAVDVLFESSAQSFGAGTIAVVLSGAMWDGAKGTAAVAKAGGITIAQDERSCDHFDMPAAAIDLGRADLTMSPSRIAEALQLLTETGLTAMADPG